jgi:hypothetical protein
VDAALQSTKHGADLSSYQAAQVSRAQRRAEIAVFRHGLGTMVQAEFARQDALAVSDAARTALEEELDLLDYGLHRANGSAAKTELVARKVQMLASLNDRRLIERFAR